MASPRNIQAADFPAGRKQCLLFHCPATAQLAQRVAQVSDNVELGEITWDRFEDGFPNLFVKNAVHIRNRHVAFLASFYSVEAIFEQISVIYALPRLFVGSFTLVLPFFPTGTHERVTHFNGRVGMWEGECRSNQKGRWRRRLPCRASCRTFRSPVEDRQVW